MTPFQSKLAEKYFDYAIRYANTFINRKAPARLVDEDELRSAAILGLVEAAASYSPRKGLFKPLASRSMRKQLLNTMAEELNWRRKVDRDVPTSVESRLGIVDSGAITAETEKRIHKWRRKNMTNMQIRASRFCWMKDQAHSVVAKKMGISVRSLYGYLAGASRTARRDPVMQLAWDELRGVA